MKLGVSILLRNQLGSILLEITTRVVVVTHLAIALSIRVFLSYSSPLA